MAYRSMGRVEQMSVMINVSRSERYDEKFNTLSGYLFNLAVSHKKPFCQP
jgi:hypothetical protein